MLVKEKAPEMSDHVVDTDNMRAAKDEKTLDGYKIAGTSIHVIEL